MIVPLNSSQISNALALDPVLPLQWITPVQPQGIAKGGLSRSAFNPSNPSNPSGAEFVIEPFTGVLNWVMAVYDVVTIYVRGINTGVSKTIYAGEENDRFLLHVPENWFKNGVNDVGYRVTRPSGNYADSPTLRLLYNNPAPTVTVSHPPSVGPGQTAVFTMTISDSRPYDTVTLTIGTWSITFSNPTSPIKHTLTAAELLLIKDGIRPITVTVHDQLTNTSVPATSSITITANQKFYHSPIIPNAETNNKVLDVTALAGQAAIIHARTHSDMVPDQPCWMRVDSFKADGTAHNHQLWSGLPAKTNLTWIASGIYAQPLPYSYLAALGNGATLTIKYWVDFTRTNDFSKAMKFQDQVYTIKAQAAAVLTFLNAPYTAVAGKLVAGIELMLMQAGQPTGGATVVVTLPPGTTFSDGSTSRSFVTGTAGNVTITGVTASGAAGTFSITAVSGGSTASAVLTITALAPLGPIALSPTVMGVTYSSDGKLAYVTGPQLVQEIDATQSSLRKQIALPTLGVSWEIALNKDDTLAFACNGTNAVSVIDTKTNALISSIPVAGHPIGIVLSRDYTRAYVSTWQTGNVAIIDAINLTVIKTIPVQPYARGIDISPDGQWIYVAIYGNGSAWAVMVINTATQSVVRTVPLPVTGYGVAASPDGKSFYVCGINNNLNGSVLQYDAQTFTLIRSISVIGFPRGIVLNHAGTRAYCCDRDTDTVTTIDTAQGTVIATTIVGQGPLQIAISQDDERALVPCVYDNTLWVISLLPGSASQGANSVSTSGATSSSSTPRLPLDGDAY